MYLSATVSILPHYVKCEYIIVCDSYNNSPLGRGAGVGYRSYAGVGYRAVQGLNTWIWQ